ncbi:TRAP transporter small permease [Methylobrevis albus]|uniref:TRAP transporter small permease protein n=1 Tax=Methylobrevis albus TaxID=2793297 RepID=A0A931MY61_9HYPH|nr:TRAP transporter small permease [Methylobrevis albus]MBH0236754.1 TRAP transporter small permease [Methylobrevis albus]
MPPIHVVLEEFVAKALLAAIVVLVFLAAAARTFGHPLIWSVDLAQLLFVWLCMLGANKALRRKSHIGVDFFVLRLPTAMRRIVEIVLGLLTLGFLGALAYLGVRLTLLNAERIYGDSGISYAWVTGAVPVGCVLLALTLIGHLVRCLRGGALVFLREDAPRPVVE